MFVFVCKGHFWWRQTWRHLYVTMLQCWDKFYNVLVHWSIRMIHAKNYETVSKFVKVMTKIRWPRFSGHGVVVQKRTSELWRHLPYGIRRCYLPPNTSEHVPPNPSPARINHPGGTKDWVDLGGWIHTEVVYLSAVAHSSSNRPVVEPRSWLVTLLL